MLFDNLPTPMPWYPKIELQDRFRENVATDPTICQLAPNDGLLPFQFFKNATSEIPKKWFIRCMSNGTIEDYLNGYIDEQVVDLTPYITSALQWGSVAAGDFFIFTNDSNAVDLITPTLPDGLPPGFYYMEMWFVEGTPDRGTARYVSETFKVPEQVFSWIDPESCKFPYFKWWHNTDLKPIHYLGDGTFYNLLYLDTFITASEPEIEYIDPEKDGLGEQIPTLIKAIIKYKVSAVMPDYLKIALFVMQLHENKIFTTERNLRQGQIKNPEVQATLTDDGAYSIVDVLFEQDTIITSSNCENELAPAEPFITPDGDTLTTGYCNGSGSVNVSMTTVSAGVYCELWGKVGAGPYTFRYGPISRADVLAGTTVHIAAGAGVTRFMIKMRTFGFYTGQSAESIPVPTC